MADLARLMDLNGATAAGQFGNEGELVDYAGDLPKDHAEMIARMCAANTSMGKMEAEGFTRYTGMNWLPFKGWAVSAGDYSVCVVGDVGVFVETKDADFNQIFRTLGEEAGVT